MYFTHERECFIRDEVIYAHANVIPLKPTEKVEKMQVRFRTIGDISCTGAVLSIASTLQEIVNEVAATRTTERGSRIDDKRSDAAMEDRKRLGYF